MYNLLAYLCHVIVAVYQEQQWSIVEHWSGENMSHHSGSVIYDRVGICL